MISVYIGLGSNLQEPEQQLRSAIEQLRQLPDSRYCRHSSLYRSKPLGPQDQPDYINSVCLIETTLTPLALLDKLQQIELDHGRERLELWGARTLDLDILLYGGQVIQNERLTIPHAELCNRNFVVGPLLEIEPDLMLPGSRAISDIWDNLDKTGLEKLPE